jgi:hypothetical protein
LRRNVPAVLTSVVDTEREFWRRAAGLAISQSAGGMTRSWPAFPEIKAVGSYATSCGSFRVCAGRRRVWDICWPGSLSQLASARRRAA